MLHSIYIGLKESKLDTVICYSDIIFDQKVFRLIKKLNNKKYLTLPLLKNWRNLWIKRNKLQILDAEEIIMDKNNFIKKIGKLIFKTKILKINLWAYFICLKISELT